MEAAKQQALKELLNMIVQTGLLESLAMPSEKKPSDPISEIEEKIPSEPKMDEMEDDEEIAEEPVSLSITQLGAAKKPMPKQALEEVKQMVKGKGRRRKRRGK
jgi:hypothetical protein